LGSETFAQRKLITGKEWVDSYEKSTSKIRERSWRAEKLFETVLDGVVVKSVTNTIEYLPPDRSHNHTKMTEGDKVIEIEQISIGYMQYDRKDGGAWTKLDTRQDHGNGSGNGSGRSSSWCDQFAVGPTTLNGEPMQLLARLTVEGVEKELVFRESKLWIGDDGFPYRIWDTSGKLSPREETTRRVTTYEYDPKITIEAPIK
jgi:hypothetical protein